MEEIRQRVSLAAMTGTGEPLEIVAITAGEGNGWKFGAEVLRSSLPAWDGVECFVDHAGRAGLGRSVRDLGGVCSQPRWDDASQGVRLTLTPFGPAAELVVSLARAMLASLAENNPAALRPRVGFSADVSFKARGREVKEIVRVHSVDLVCHPARGGAFARRKPEAGAQPVAAQFSGEKSMEEMGNTLDHAAALEPENAALNDLRRQVYDGLLESGLTASRLPQPLQDRIRAQFAGRVFEARELNRAIEDSRALVSALTGASSVHGPRISSMIDTRDQLQAAVDDLFEAPREPGMESLRVHHLSGVRELYMTLTGDFDLHGGYHPERVRLATTADFTGLVKNTMNKVVSNRWRELGRAGYNWWENICVVEHFNSLQQITGTLVGTVGSLPAVSEGMAYQELMVGDSPEVANFTKYGGYIPLTLELIDRDETRKLKAYPRELAAAGLRKISSLVAAIFSVGGGVGPTMADTASLFNADPVNTAGGHANLGTAALSAQAWEDASIAVFNQPMLVKNAAGLYGTGPRMAVSPRYLLVPRTQQLTGMKILYPALENSATIYSENQQRGKPGDVITVPEWADTNDWAAVCDPVIAPAIFVGERFGIVPEVFLAGDELSPAVFTNDEHRLKVRHFLAVWVNDFRPLYKSNVAA